MDATPQTWTDLTTLIGALAADVWDEDTICEHIARITEPKPGDSLRSVQLAALTATALGHQPGDGYAPVGYLDAAHGVQGQHSRIVTILREWTQENHPDWTDHDYGRASMKVRFAARTAGA